MSWCSDVPEDETIFLFAGLLANPDMTLRLIKSRVGNILVKVASLRINLNIDGSPITFKCHTHPSHS
jgi:hypothetical protein